jgi:uncharacterized protein YraI
MKRLARSLTAVALAIALLVLAAGPVGAAVNGDYAASGVRIRTGPSTSRTVVGLGYRGQGATIYCFTRGTTVNGNPFWVRHRNQTTSVTGYSADYYMNWAGPLGGSVPSC